MTVLFLEALGGSANRIIVCVLKFEAQKQLLRYKSGTQLYYLKSKTSLINNEVF